MHANYLTYLSSFAYGMQIAYESRREKTWKKIPTDWLSLSRQPELFVYFSKLIHPSNSPQVLIKVNRNEEYKIITIIALLKSKETECRIDSFFAGSHTLAFYNCDYIPVIFIDFSYFFLLGFL